ncbi:hypothetical protein BST81_01090 [Leptolyngbya sp. 'hensonii']|uniref:ATP-binding response regulator n=1 Tax=Leptolyngbya sp. 'hensonii' TaxID=1922337 RepID=UPI00094FCE22|nr:hybrid sensor histidine kinase/response regulator [Leptolyngbya sp. 'hensonii']OLP20359.1 hypothetical protein BST81_01090 [Leptolyngbya sp. 'hensonii']
MINAATSAKDIVLIIDDKPDNLRLLSDLLAEQQYQVRQALRGDVALKAAQLSPPDLILLDIMLPGMNGYEVCRQLKADARTQEIPIIFLSAKDDELDKVKAFSVGGSDYIAKPFQAIEVLARVEHHLQISRLQRQLQERNQQLQAQNTLLQQEIYDRVIAETALQTLNQELEAKVEERTLQLKAALEKEQQLNELKSKLLSTLSHEFRTPLASISMSTELIQERLSQAIGDWGNKQLQRIIENIQRLTQVLNNATLLALIDSHSLEIHPVSVNLFEFCAKLLKGYPKRVLNTLHSLELVESQPSSPVLVTADAFLLEHLLMNLIHNAVRYSPGGGPILLRVGCEDGQAVLQVRDSGIGIPEDEQGKIFDRFYRADNANSIPGTPGAGLGLAVAWEVAQLLQGTLGVASGAGQGTTVTVHLPLTPAGQIPDRLISF